MAIKHLARRTRGLQLSGVRTMFEMAPKEAINLTVGEPDFPPPQHIIEALYQAARSGKNKYCPTVGVEELREAIAKNLRKQRKDIAAKNIIVTCGGTQGLMLTSQTIFNPGDEVLVPDPGFVLYGPQIELMGGRPVRYRLTQENDFRPDIEELNGLVSRRTKAILVNSPSNPTGGTVTREDVKALADLASDHDLLVVSDEVYDSIVYDGSHESFLPACDKLVYINSFSKSFAMTGWRIGYLAADSELVEVMRKVHYYNIACPPTPTQYAALAGLNGPMDFIEERRREYRARRDTIVEGLNSIEGFRCNVPKGAFYAFPRFDFDMKSQELAMHILKSGVVCVPGTAFGPTGEGHLRFSYATSMENIERALPLIERAVKGLKRTR
jgi:aspartate aminotransferase